MKRIILKSVFDAFEYVMDHYYPYGLEEMRNRKDRYAVISIQDAHSNGFGFVFKPDDYCEEVLTLYFDDIDREVDGAVLFDEEMARSIFAFIERNRDIETLLVHCYAGQSRSRAIAAFAVSLFGKDNSAYFRSGNPNMYIYHTLERCWEKWKNGDRERYDLVRQIAAFAPFNEQESKDKEILLKLLKNGEDIYTRENEKYHLTVSAWVCDPSMQKVLMAYHKIYDSWAWLGGHADGERDLLQTAIREVKEESGLKEVKILSPNIFSLEVLPVNGHWKKGKYVASHLHLNLTYLLQADPEQTLHAKTDENSKVVWFTLEDAIEASSEPWFRENIYKKLNAKLIALKQ